MSGPVLGDSVYRRIEFDKPEKYSHETVRRLRELADSVETGYISEGVEEPEPIAALLRAKADKIESYLNCVDNELHGDLATLAKAVEWTNSGDYGPSSINEAWQSYGERND